MDNTCTTQSILPWIGGSALGGLFSRISVRRIRVKSVRTIFCFREYRYTRQNSTHAFQSGFRPRIFGQRAFPLFETAVPICRIGRYVSNPFGIVVREGIDCWLAPLQICAWASAFWPHKSAVTLAICRLLEIDCRRGKRESIEYHLSNRYREILRGFLPRLLFPPCSRERSAAPGDVCYRLCGQTY